jgi:hypothetical protein
MILTNDDWEALRWLWIAFSDRDAAKKTTHIDSHKLDGIVKKGLAEYRPFTNTRVLTLTEEGQKLAMVMDVMER